MKKFAFSLVLVFLVVSLFAQTVGDYDKILKGDFSAFVGYWINENNDREFLRSDGSQVRTEIFLYGKYYRVRNIAKTKGVYTWIIDGYQESYSVTLFPIGIEIQGIKTDTTKTRMFFDGSLSDPKEVYYKESEFPVTHLALQDIQLKKYPKSDSENIGTIKKGTMVLWNKGWYDGFNSNRAEKEKWAHIYTPDGLEGSCFSDNLEQIKEIEVVFPSTFTGTWKRDNYNNTITFTRSTLSASNQQFHWILSWVYGNSYMLTNYMNDGTSTITIRLLNGNLEFSGNRGTGENNWNGVWKKQ